jgi:hypothetical protein
MREGNGHSQVVSRTEKKNGGAVGRLGVVCRLYLELCALVFDC